MRSAPMRLALGLLAGILILGPWWGIGVAHATDGTPDVTADDEADAYVGRGGLVLPPGSADEGERRRVASCSGCRWRLTDPCAPDGSACLSVTHGCPHGRLLRAWSSTDDGVTWRPVGLPCIGPGGPVTVETAGRRVSEQVLEAVPDPRIGHQPPRGVLPRLPVVFRSGQPEPPPFPLSVLGRTVLVDAHPSWTWSFGDGALLVTTLPGGPYPDRAVTHAFPRPGSYEVTLTTTWSATYTLDGLGPFPLDPIRQEARAVLIVGSGRAVLVS